MSGHSSQLAIHSPREADWLELCHLDHLVDSSSFPHPDRSMAISGTSIGGTYHIEGLNFRPMYWNIPTRNGIYFRICPCKPFWVPPWPWNPPLCRFHQLFLRSSLIPGCTLTGPSDTAVEADELRCVSNGTSVGDAAAEFEEPAVCWGKLGFMLVKE